MYSPHPLDEIASLAVREVPAAQTATVACAYRDRGVWYTAVGADGQLNLTGAFSGPSTLFDLASVTKPFVAVTFARLVREGLVSWDMPLGVLVREAHGTPSALTPLGWLLAHRGGLEGHRPLYAPLLSSLPVSETVALVEAASAWRAECLDGTAGATGHSPLYSDLGYLLIGYALERATGKTLDSLIAQHVSAPLQVAVASSAQWMRSRGVELEMCAAPTEDVPWRGGVVRGLVHDENAWALGARGCSGHAGLFASADAVASFGCAILDVLEDRRDDWLTRDELEYLVRPRADGTLRAGFDGKSEGASSAGSLCSPQTFGHLGFTGTSLWMDPERQVVTVLLTNRVHPSRENDAIKRARPLVHDALFRWAFDRSTRG